MRIIIVLVLVLMAGCSERPNVNEIRLRAEIVELQQKLDASREETKLVMSISDQWRDTAYQCSAALSAGDKVMTDVSRRMGKIIKDSNKGTFTPND